MATVLIDANVLIDVATDDPAWADWSAAALERAGQGGRLVIDPVVYAEVSVAFDRIEDLDALLPGDVFHREALPWEAAFLAGKAFLAYRCRGGTEEAPLPDFYIGAHAAVRGYRLLTRDRGRFATYFPTVLLIVGLFVVSCGSGRVEDAAAQEFEAGAAVGLALDELEAGDLALGLGVAPRRRERGAHGGAVVFEPGGEGLDHCGAAGPRLRDPCLEGAGGIGVLLTGPDATAAHEGGEAPREAGDARRLGILLDAGDRGGRGPGQRLRGLHEHPGQRLGGGQ